MVKSARSSETATVMLDSFTWLSKYLKNLTRKFELLTNTVASHLDSVDLWGNRELKSKMEEAIVAC